MRTLKGFRTLIFNALMSIVMLVNLWDPGADMPGANEVGTLIDTADAFITGVWGAGNIFLRFITTTPVGEKL